MNFIRHRRTRANAILRDLIAETHVSIDDLIQPIFVEEGLHSRKPILEMPGVDRIPETELSQRIHEIETWGIKAIILFGVSHNKDAIGSDTLSESGLLFRMVKAAKKAAKSSVIIADICFCEYTDHGHCGIFEGDDVANDKTIKNLAIQAVIAAKAGADLIAPSAMMDGQITAMRRALDEHGFHQLPIMSYSTKFSSALYGPFRVAGGTNLKGTRDTYMIDYRNGREAIRESMVDIEEQADILMVKPGLHYLDILKQVRENTKLPLCVYHVSGEYAMWKFAAQSKAIDEDRVLFETMISFKRAGADLIITYAAEHMARLLSKDRQ